MGAGDRRRGAEDAIVWPPGAILPGPLSSPRLDRPGCLSLRDHGASATRLVADCVGRPDLFGGRDRLPLAKPAFPERDLARLRASGSFMPLRGGAHLCAGRLSPAWRPVGWAKS